MEREPLREILRQDLSFARTQTDRLFRMLAPAAIHERPIPERHRVIFYLGHLEAFDWNMICAGSFGMPSLNSQFDRLFEFGIDPVDGQLPADQPSDWPGVEEIISYRDRTRAAVDDILNRATPANGQIFRVAIEHRLMHAETLAYMFHWLDYELKRERPPAALGGRPLHEGDNAKRAIRIPSGHATLGQTVNGQSSSFGWDNEFQSHSAFVPEFSIDPYNVTNADFLRFVRAGCYEDRSLWTSDARTWVQQAGIRHPKFWIRRGDDWFYRTMFEAIPLPPDWPVYVSHAEASAYARWKRKSLPTEAQYHRAAFGSPDGAERFGHPEGNFGFRSWTPTPVGSFPPSPFGIFDLAGNGWEWTSTPFAPFDGFEPFPFYRGYSADFFDGKHFVLKGASPRTAAALVRRSFRNWFQAYYPNVYATFRCVEN